MTRNRLQKKMDPEEDKLFLPSSSEDEEEQDSDASVEVQDPFETADIDSDDAPEAVSFKSAFEDSKALRRQTTQVIKTQLEEKRKRRKEIHDQYLLEKEQKRQKIDSKKLPDDILDDLDDNPIPPNTQPLVAENEEEEENFEGDENIRTSIPTEEIVAVHGPTMFKCKILPVEAKKPKYVPEKIANFKDQLLYGGRIRRERSTRDAVLKKEKQLARHHQKSVC